MKQSLQLRLGQHLTMTPQLQQAIRLLQLSTIELRSEIQEALETNPMLEMSEEEGQRNDEARSEHQEGGGTDSILDSDNLSDQITLDMHKDSLPTDLPVDSSWEDTYDLSTNYNYTGSGAASGEDNREYETRGQDEDTLQEHLIWQARLSHFSEVDLAIATAIIDSIDEDGYLATPLEEIFDSLRSDLDVEFDEVEAVLHRVHSFDPVGVGARDLQESLTIQLQQISADTPWHKEAMSLLKTHFQLLANRDFNQLMRKLKVNEDGLREIVQLIHTLNPRPGNAMTSSQAEYIVPDVYVKKVKEKWVVSLNPESTPKLNINSMYAGLIQRANKSADNTYLQGQLQEARWLIKSLQSRNETLMKVAKCIVERQQGFLEHGEEAMKALVLHDVAEAVGMHESTISRITNKKYMHTPRGIFELKYFFSSHVSTASGGECSSTAIRALIKKMVSAEDARKPLSDSKIAKILSEQGINVARRTVAKYRDAMAIPPSNERKRIT
ncbi:MAG: RNA polymerase factor sigma-54 [Gammaproteobacteria bacterium]|nr:RNA polymerase factor sigma-54 [Gammaproteobacteria bacterium]